jgi:hypothetical protein
LPSLSKRLNSICLVLLLATPIGAQESRPRLYAVDDNVYRRLQPTTQDLANLASHGIRMVLGLGGALDHEGWEQQAVEAARMRCIRIGMSGFFASSDHAVDKILATLDDSSLGPIFVHYCRGADRRGVALACYRITHEHSTKARAIRVAGLKLAMDPLGRASEPCSGPINSEYPLDITVVNEKIDPASSFMAFDHDGVIRMDHSSPYAMERLVGPKHSYRVACGSDPDSDRHGIVTPPADLMDPNRYLAVAIRYLLAHRPLWSQRAAIGETGASSSMIDRVVQSLGWRLCEVPVGSKWLVAGLFDGSCCFITGLKVATANGRFAARLSGMENIYKINAENFQGEAHRDAILDEAEGIVDRALNPSKGPL